MAIVGVRKIEKSNVHAGRFYFDLGLYGRVVRR